MKNKENANTTYNLKALEDYFNRRETTPQEVAGEIDELIQHLCSTVETNGYIHELPNIFYAMFALRDALQKAKGPYTPITEENLLNLGFKKINNTGLAEDIIFRLRLNNYYIDFDIYKDFYFFREMAYGHGMHKDYLSDNLKYIEQIKQIYRALEGKEL